ncbi:unnamed protein product [Vicia faba]|uniref:Uncharacterized protein n=1 Tax=Vicia faba TaxID=3906 RepID=A0AAV1ARG7_VICFA|nr:unnamed protein product [Vicia faba]
MDLFIIKVTGLFFSSQPQDTGLFSSSPHQDTSGKKEKIKSRLNVSGTAGIRKSARETPLKKIIASSSSTQNSKQVEKRILPTPEARRKSKSVEKRKIPSPLIRSGRTKNHSSSSPSNSKSAGSLGSISKLDMHKCLAALDQSKTKTEEKIQFGIKEGKT